MTSLAAACAVLTMVAGTRLTSPRQRPTAAPPPGDSRAGPSPAAGRARPGAVRREGSSRCCCSAGPSTWPAATSTSAPAFGWAATTISWSRWRSSCSCRTTGARSTARPSRWRPRWAPARQPAADLAGSARGALLARLRQDPGGRCRRRDPPRAAGVRPCRDSRLRRRRPALGRLRPRLARVPDPAGLRAPRRGRSRWTASRAPTTNIAVWGVLPGADLGRDPVKAGAALLLLACGAVACRHGQATGPRLGAAIPFEPSRDALLDRAAARSATGHPGGRDRADRRRRSRARPADRSSTSGPSCWRWRDASRWRGCPRRAERSAADRRMERLRRLVEIERVRLARNPGSSPRPRPARRPAAGHGANVTAGTAPQRFAGRWRPSGGPTRRSSPSSSTAARRARRRRLARPDAPPTPRSRWSRRRRRVTARPSGRAALWLQASVLDVTQAAPRAGARWRVSSRWAAPGPRAGPPRRTSVSWPRAGGDRRSGDPAGRVLATGRAALRLDLAPATVRALRC